jgi:hypothetical protein
MITGVYTHNPIVSAMRFFASYQNSNCRPAVSINFAQDRVVLAATESEAHTKLVRQPSFRDSVAIKFSVQEEVKSAIVPLDHFEDRVCDWRVFSSSAHATPPDRIMHASLTVENRRFTTHNRITGDMAIIADHRPLRSALSRCGAVQTPNSHPAANQLRSHTLMCTGVRLR